MADYKEFVREPFAVEATQITQENIQEFAEILGKEKDVKTSEDGVNYILLDKKVIPNGWKAYVGWWVTRMPNHKNVIVYRVYPDPIFWDQFSDMTDPWRQWFEDRKASDDILSPPDETEDQPRLTLMNQDENKDSSPAEPIQPEGELIGSMPVDPGVVQSDEDIYVQKEGDGPDNWTPSDALPNVGATQDDPE